MALLVASCSSTYLHTQDMQQNKALWDDDVYLLKISSDATYEHPSWSIKHSDGKRSKATSAEEVIAHFSKQVDEKKKRGMFIYSPTYRVPDTEEERKVRSTLDWKLYYNEAWKKAEAELIQDLVAACKSEKILVYVNLSSNLAGEWEQLSP